VAAGTKYRPRLELSRSAFENTLILVAGMGLIFSITATISSWPALPQRIPSHFNMAGEPDGWSGRSILILLPVVSLTLYLMLTIFSSFPHIYNYPFPITEKNANRQYSLARSLLLAIDVEITWLFAYIQRTSIQVALGHLKGLGPLFIMIFVSIIFFTTGIYFWMAYKVR
jgi:uncharacterized membrane protein